MLHVAKAKAYYSLWQFKADAWSSLEDAAVQLSVASAGERSLEQAVDTAIELLDVLGPIERLYAYPGPGEFSNVRRMFAAGKYDEFAAMVGEINRSFVTDSFRTGQVRNLGRADQAFDRDEQQERALREELRQARRPDGQFVFEIVVVPSFDEAFMTTIGTSRSSVAYLVEVLVSIARDLDHQIIDMSMSERAAQERAVLRLTAPSAPLTDFSGFHPSFTSGPRAAYPGRGCATGLLPVLQRHLLRVPQPEEWRSPPWTSNSLSRRPAQPAAGARVHRAANPRAIERHIRKEQK